MKYISNFFLSIIMLRCLSLHSSVFEEPTSCVEVQFTHVVSLAHKISDFARPQYQYKINKQLYKAVHNDDFVAAEDALANGGDINYDTHYILNGNLIIGPPLFIAINQGSPDMIAFLLQRGANINYHRKGFGNCLHKALDVASGPDPSKVPEIVELLINNGAHVYVQDSFGRPPMFVLMYNTKLTESKAFYIFRCLRDAGARSFILPDWQSKLGQEFDVRAWLGEQNWREKYFCLLQNYQKQQAACSSK